MMRNVSKATFLRAACNICDSMTKRQTTGTALQHIWYFWISEAVGRLFICHYLTVSAGGKKTQSVTWVMNIRLYRVCVWYMRSVDNRHLVVPYGWTRLPRYKDSKYGGKLSGTGENSGSLPNEWKRTWLWFTIMTRAAPESFSRTCELLGSKIKDFLF